MDTMVAAQILGFRGRCLRVTTVAVLAWLVASMSTSGLSHVSAGRNSCHRDSTEKLPRYERARLLVLSSLGTAKNGSLVGNKHF